MELNKEIITPAYAEHLLTKNANNRPLKRRHVEFLANEIIAGRWQETGDTIKLSVSERLLDGQHRLSAIVKANVPVECWIARNCAEEIFKVIDTGKSRSAADVIATAGHEYYTIQSAAARVLINYERGFKDVRSRIANQEVLEYVSTHELVDFARQAATWYAFNRLINVGDLAAVYYLFYQANQVKAYKFLDQLVRGTGLKEKTPVYVLRNKFQQARDGRFAYGQLDRIALMIKAFNTYLTNSECTRLYYNPSEEFPKVAHPEPELATV